MGRDEYVYVGSELEVFKYAQNWKRYWCSVITPYLHGVVLEVGAGVGANSPYLLNPKVSRLVCVEPDRGFAERLEADKHTLGGSREYDIDIRIGVVQDLGADERFDAILYLDVLEHTEHDREEIVAAAARLCPGGHLIVMCPAFQGLYSEFDRAIGHYRRYTASTLRALTPSGLAIRQVRYLDAVGACLSAANRLVLHKATPTLNDIVFWDRCVIPVSRIADRLLGRFVGRSVLCVWRKEQ